MNIPIIISYFECENCLNDWRIFRDEEVMRSRCLGCDVWNYRYRLRVVYDRNTNIKAYGNFQCRCENEWTSANAWILYKQKCKLCKKKSYPIRLYHKYNENENNVGNDLEGEEKMHKRESCDKCWESGDCTRIISDY